MYQLRHILLLLIITFGAGNLILAQKSTLKSNQFADGTWYSAKKKHFIEFDGDTVRHNLLSEDTVACGWRFDEKTSLLSLMRTVHAEQSIDSTVLVTDDAGQRMLYYYGGELVATRTEDQVIQETGIDTLTVLLDKNELKLSSKSKQYVMTQPTKMKDVNMSFSLASIGRGLLGLMVLIIISWLASSNRSAINWSLILKGMALQIIIALLVLKVPAVEAGFNTVSEKFVQLIGYTDAGVSFLFAQFGTNAVQAPLLTFAIKVLPTIIFFSALVSLFYYWGVLQKIVYAFAWIMKKFMRLSGAESLAAAGNVFLGQTEAPLLVKPYLATMTKSEIMCLMTGGMATIAGGVLAAYVNFLGGDDPVQQAFFAKHLLTASIISAPAAIVAAKILVPERDQINEKLEISKEKIGTNALEAISNGTTDGLRLAVNVGAMLLVFIALMALANGLLNWVGGWTGLNEAIAKGGIYAGLSFEFILGYACRPIVWLMGVDWADSVYVGELLGTKTILNEFVAYPRLGEMKEAGL
ncbi:MAG: hypothetical protein A3D92_23860, partial [Bacteroidetes bacterium RIFCSPHIGHO2_02_FULL_44_7]